MSDGSAEPDFLFQNQEPGADREELLGIIILPLQSTIDVVNDSFSLAFLRHSEYFRGIIFLTTNLTRTIDLAVTSRAQINLSFPALTEPLRVRVWQNFIERLPEDVGTLSPVDLVRLAMWEINGREIKNILNMSVSWCRKKKRLLTLEVVENLLTTICPSASRHREDGVTNGINGSETKGSDLEDMLLLNI